VHINDEQPRICKIILVFLVKVNTIRIIYEIFRKKLIIISNNTPFQMDEFDSFDR